MTLFELDSRKLFRLSRLDSRAFPAAAQPEQPREHVMSQRCPRPSPSAASASACGTKDRGVRQRAATRHTTVAPESEYSTELRLHLSIDSNDVTRAKGEWRVAAQRTRSFTVQRGMRALTQQWAALPRGCSGSLYLKTSSPTQAITANERPRRIQKAIKANLNKSTAATGAHQKLYVSTRYHGQPLHASALTFVSSATQHTPPSKGRAALRDSTAFIAEFQ